MVKQLTLTRCVAIAAAAIVAMAGCTATEGMGERPAGRGNATFGPAAELADAARHLRQTSFAVTMTVDLDRGTSTVTGTMDARKKIGSFTATASGRGDDQSVTEWRMLSSTLYAKTSINGAAVHPQRPWRRMKTELTDKPFDAARMAHALTQATAVQRSDPQRFTGILDGTTANTALALPAPATTGRTGASAPAATSVAFTADVDDHGRLTGYRATVTPSNGRSRTAALTFSDYGTTVIVQPPPPGRTTGTTID